MTQFPEKQQELSIINFILIPKRKKVLIDQSLTNSIQNCILFPPDHSYVIPENETTNSIIEVTNEDIVSCTNRLSCIENHQNIVVLNFASAVLPGGSWASFGKAQEESITRASGLFASLISQPTYYFENRKLDVFYSDYIMYSPTVPFFRDSKNMLIDVPYDISVITSPAVKAKMLDNSEETKEKLFQTMLIRCRKIIQCAIQQRHKVITLGAFGCGVFRNDPKDIAEIFRILLIDENLKKFFEYIVFPMPETHGSLRSSNIDAFAQVFEVEINRY